MSKELWLDTEGMLSAGYSGNIEIIVDLCGVMYFDLI